MDRYAPRARSLHITLDSVRRAKGVGHPDSICDGIADDLGAEYAAVTLLSQIGAPVTEPLAVEVETTTRDDGEIRRLVTAELERLDSFSRALVAGDVRLF
ncbi:hypothetical protein [Natronorubrum sulfidifaciens]|uniref:Methionine adenosyltransferase n=1 Tax=Natronorubrum sulfidifaciens JCM 14089 TaxID=1230460 RepID=L9W556_9EURY|nr:hypothetical protein [Natronorubrum sulfidifaciens]ELY44580.1 methionine adenosyltransferase [Natronorubrum sulfidifaciens JCM 14089]